MNKFSPTQTEVLLALVIYLLFKRDDSRDALEIAKRIGMYKQEQGRDSQVQYNEIGDLKDWIELGCKVNFAWLEKQSNLDALVMSTFQLQQLRIQDFKAYSEIQFARIKERKRWSNDWKVILPRVIAAKSLQMARPHPETVDLTWVSRTSACARDLIQAGKKSEAEAIRLLSVQSAF